MPIAAVTLISLGTILSMAGWVWFVFKNHDPNHPATLSELAARSPKNRQYFRLVLWVCGPLFGIGTVVLASSLDSQLLVMSWLLTVALELLTGVFVPSNKRHTILHNVVAYSMAVCMWLSAIVAAVVLTEVSLVLWLLLGIMAACAVCASLRRKQFVFYELGFLFSAHLTMVVSAIAVL